MSGGVNFLKSEVKNDNKMEDFTHLACLFREVTGTMGNELQLPLKCVLLNTNRICEL